MDRFDGFQVGVGGGRPDGTARGDEGEASVKLGSPAEVAAAIPHFFGFHPDDSLVVLGLSRSAGDGRAAISHGLRADLSSATRGPAAFGRWVAGRLVDSGANEALCVIYPREDGSRRLADYRRTVAGMCSPLRTAGVAPLDVLFVADGRWWSFLCDRSGCCPAEGSPIDANAGAIAALSAYSGLAVLPNRAALAAGLAPYGDDMPERMRAACDAALVRLAAAHKADQRAGIAGTVEVPYLSEHGYPDYDDSSDDDGKPLSDEPNRIVPDDEFDHDHADDPMSVPASDAISARDSATDWATDSATESTPVLAPAPVAEATSRVLDFDWPDVERAWRLADNLCDGQVPPDRALTDEEAGELLVSMADVRVRDYLATWCGDDRAGQAVALGVELARRAVTAEQSAAAYSVAAWAAWALGWGAWSRLCLDRANHSVPGYALASLIKQGLDRGVGPELVRQAARGTARRLNDMQAEYETSYRDSPRARGAR
ncbi:MAG: DUF4192 domain-containing protein [Actinocrinis sp.]